MARPYDLETANTQAERLRMCMAEAGYEIGVVGDVVVHPIVGGYSTYWLSKDGSWPCYEHWWRARELVQLDKPKCLKHFMLSVKQSQECNAPRRLMQDCEV